MGIGRGGQDRGSRSTVEKIAEDKNLSGFESSQSPSVFVKGDADFAETTLKTYFDGGGAVTNRNLIAFCMLMQQGIDDAKEYFEEFYIVLTGTVRPLPKDYWPPETNSLLLVIPAMEWLRSF